MPQIKEQTIKDFMKTVGGRLSYDNKWMVHDTDENGEDVWEVYQQKYHQRVKQITRTYSLLMALSDMENEDI